MSKVRVVVTSLSSNPCELICQECVEGISLNLPQLSLGLHDELFRFSFHLILVAKCQRSRSHWFHTHLVLVVHSCECDIWRTLWCNVIFFKFDTTVFDSVMNWLRFGGQRSRSQWLWVHLWPILVSVIYKAHLDRISSDLVQLSVLNQWWTVDFGGQRSEVKVCCRNSYLL